MREMRGAIAIFGAAEPLPYIATARLTHCIRRAKYGNRGKVRCDGDVASTEWPDVTVLYPPPTGGSEPRLWHEQ